MVGRPELRGREKALALSLSFLVCLRFRRDRASILLGDADDSAGKAATSVTGRGTQFMVAKTEIILALVNDHSASNRWESANTMKSIRGMEGAIAGGGGVAMACCAQTFAPP